ncbi:hypothetical protein D3C73_845500 [compost metagenome]
MVSLDDGLAHRQAQAHAGRCGFAVAAREFFEDAAFGARRDARAVVAHGHAQHVVVNRCVNVHGAAGGRVLGGVFKQVAQHALDQHPIALHQRQVRQGGHGHAVRGQGLAHGGQRRAHQFFNGLPFQAQWRVVALQPRHIQ